MSNRIPPTLHEDNSVSGMLSKRFRDITHRMCVGYCKHYEAAETEAPDCSIQTICAECPLREL